MQYSKSIIGLALIVISLLLIAVTLYTGRITENFIGVIGATIILYVVAFYHFKLSKKPS